MTNRVVVIKARKKGNQKELVQKAIKATLSQNGVVIVRGTKVKEICAAKGYHRSVEMPICGTAKLKVY